MSLSEVVAGKFLSDNKDFGTKLKSVSKETGEPINEDLVDRVLHKEGYSFVPFSAKDLLNCIQK